MSSHFIYGALLQERDDEIKILKASVEQAKTERDEARAALADWQEAEDAYSHCDYCGEADGCRCSRHAAQLTAAQARRDALLAAPAAQQASCPQAAVREASCSCEGHHKHEWYDCQAAAGQAGELHRKRLAVVEARKRLEESRRTGSVHTGRVCTLVCEIAGDCYGQVSDLTCCKRQQEAVDALAALGEPAQGKEDGDAGA